VSRPKRIGWLRFVFFSAIAIALLLGIFYASTHVDEVKHWPIIGEIIVILQAWMTNDWEQVKNWPWETTLVFALLIVSFVVWWNLDKISKRPGMSWLKDKITRHPLPSANPDVFTVLGTERLEEAAAAYKSAIEVFEAAKANNYIEVAKNNLDVVQSLIDERKA